MISSCAKDNLVKQLQADAKKQGEINAGINLPPYPAECWQDEPYIPIKPGDQKVAIIDRSDRAIDRANARKNRCGPVFYGNVLKQFDTSQKIAR
ncbi:hypothetical protein EVB71_051 [Rhizobium phage RHph_Y55]|nr:hypothetical protein EVB71_051 [Rhizobium phage RHph_Y55]